MPDHEEEHQTQLKALRAELKKWEADFRAANGGRSAGRADAKNDATIDAKYRLYNQLTKRSTSRYKTSAPDATPQKSTRPSEFQQPEPGKTLANTAATPKRTPSKSKHFYAQSPTHEVEATPAFIRCGLGPTPQKDGHVLGIFDLISSATPSKGSSRKDLCSTDALIARTPSKPTHTASDFTPSRTPEAGTPLKRKRDQDDMGTSSSSRRKFATPAFLRRSFPLASIDEEGAEAVPARPLFPKRGLVRSLSTIIQGLKKQEDERMDEEWEIMNELEQEGQQESQQDGRKEKATASVLVGDSQAAEMPLGPDQAAESSEESVAEGGNPARKPWKKKGLKRQTRRVIMRPVLHTSKKAEDLDQIESDTEFVAARQPRNLPREGGSDDKDDDGNAYGSDFDIGHEQDGRPGRTVLKKAGNHKNTKTGKEKTPAKESKKARKVNPDAHANFRKLKIKNKNSKANGRGRRFGGRR